MQEQNRVNSTLDSASYHTHQTFVVYKNTVMEKSQKSFENGHAGEL